MTDKESVVLVVSGSIAAYKAAELARAIMELGLDVRVAMTRNAEKFITPLTFEALTGGRVLRAGFPEPGEPPMEHITFSRGARLVVVAPATADLIARMAGGLADDNITSMLLATDLPVIVAPAMNVMMYRHPATQSNIALLASRGVMFAGPESGELACGDEGEGRLAPIPQIITAVREKLSLGDDLEGRALLITAGGTREPIDAARYIGNRSSGKMGVALARAAARRGAKVTLVAGIMDVEPPGGVETIRVESAAAMLDEVERRFPGVDALVMAAAVADYRAEQVSGLKVKKAKRWDLPLVENTDILARMAERRQNQILAGFAAETHDVEAAGREKLLRKNLDMIVINDVSRSDIGFGAEENEVTILTRQGAPERVAKAPKARVADAILDRLVFLINNRKRRGEAAG